MEASQEPESVIVIDDDYAMRLSCEQTLARVGYRVRTFGDGAQGLDAVGEIRPALVVVDLKMPGLSGLEVIERLRAIDATVTIIVITGYATIGTAVDAMKAGAYDFLPKPFLPDELRLIVHRGLERRRLQLASRQCELDRELERRRFVTFVSHQLKTPLVAVHQYLDVLRQIGDTPDAAARRAEWLDRCLVRTDELRRLIDDWLTLAQLEGGTLERERVPLDLRDVVRAVAASAEVSATEAGITVAVEAADAPATVRGDRTCLGVLVENLLTNAIKYNRRGGSVTVRVEPGPGEVVLEVRDTGVGIPAHRLELLLERQSPVRDSAHHHSSNALEFNSAGLGLGLSIVRGIARAHGGWLRAESREHQGSTFTLVLPAAESPGALAA